MAEFKVGDSVRENWSGIVGTVIEDEPDEDGRIGVRWPSKYARVRPAMLVHAPKRIEGRR